MILVIGEILADVFPDYQRIGGAPFNFAYHLKQFGVPVRFVSRIGNDALGRDILSVLNRSGFDTDLIQIDEQKPTGRVTVTPEDGGGHRFEIEPDVAYDYIELPDTPEDLSQGKPFDLIYFGTLVQRTTAAFSRLQDFLAHRASNTEGFYDINLRPKCYTNQIIEKSLYQADILKLNEEELAYIRNMFDRRLPAETFPRWLMETYRISCIAMTRGEQGSELFTADTHEVFAVPPLKNIVDTVGAGDAYSAILAIGHLNDWPAERILSTGTDFAARICQIKGAVPEDMSFYDPFFKRITGEING